MLKPTTRFLGSQYLKDWKSWSLERAFSRAFRKLCLEHEPSNSGIWNRGFCFQRFFLVQRGAVLKSAFLWQILCCGRDSSHNCARAKPAGQEFLPALHRAPAVCVRCWSRTNPPCTGRSRAHEHYLQSAFGPSCPNVALVFSVH